MAVGRPSHLGDREGSCSLPPPETVWLVDLLVGAAGASREVRINPVTGKVWVLSAAARLDRVFGSQLGWLTCRKNQRELAAVSS
jgi:hypothetical protein